MEEQLERDRMSKVRMDCKAQVTRYWSKSCRGGGNAPVGCVPADPNHNKSYCDPPNISPLAPKKGRWQRSHQRINEGDGDQRADARHGGRGSGAEKKEQREQWPSRDPPPVVHKRDA
ncbi:hypothetical protein TNCV_144301 [Trichonephila clavipes]|nr:hypothetical protein TNCV_144301 [Trichonephila clavipes]